MEAQGVVRTDRREREDRFADLVAEHSDRLLRIAYLLCYDLGEAEDLVQETWARIARRWQRVGRLDNPFGYARQVLVNVAIDTQPARGRRRSELGSDTGRDHAPIPDAHTDRDFASVEARDELTRALAQLTTRQRAVLVLRYWEDIPEQQVAQLLGCSVGTVKSTASKALVRLRRDFAAAQASFSPRETS
jgi:RNA polymerase sigma-70 factor (sigma-E family)